MLYLVVNIIRYSRQNIYGENIKVGDGDRSNDALQGLRSTHN